jgi:WD40 repeat protein
MPRKLLAGRYLIVECLGNGGFGSTYLAEDQHLPNRPHCVVKQFQFESVNPDTLESAKRLFETEANTLNQLGRQSDQIPQLFAYFEEDQEFYLVLEFMEGDDLSHELVPGKPLSEEQVTTLLKEILEVLKFVHSHGVIHRDLKPQHIIRRKKDGKLTLIDFGAVKKISSQVFYSTQPGQTRTSIIIGTPGYMPNEQQRGKPHFSSDIYAVGVIAIEALTGLRLHELKEDPHTGILLWHHQAQVRPQLADILDRMVSPYFKDRYQCVEEVLRDLPRARNAGSNPAIRFLRQRFALTHLSLDSLKILWILLSMSVLFVLAGSGYWILRLMTVPKIPTMTQQFQAGIQKTLVDRIALANTLTMQRSGPVFSVAIAPDGQTFVSGSADGKVRRWRMQTEELLHTFTGHAKAVVSVTLSQNGQTLVSGSRDGTVKLWDLPTGTILHTLKGHLGRVGTVAITPDGKTVASGDESDTIKLWDVKTGKLLRTIAGHRDELECVTFSLSGQTLASGSKDKTIKIWDWQTGKLRHTLTGHGKEVEFIALSSNGRILVSGGADRIIIWNLESGKRIRALPGRSGHVRSVALSPDGQTLVSSHEDNTIKFWNLKSGEHLRTLAGHSDWPLSVAISPDGQTVISGGRDGTIKIWKTS